jgi:hypothetical protein
MPNAQRHVSHGLLREEVAGAWLVPRQFRLVRARESATAQPVVRDDVLGGILERCSRRARAT